MEATVIHNQSLRLTSLHHPRKKERGGRSSHQLDGNRSLLTCLPTSRHGHRRVGIP